MQIPDRKVRALRQTMEAVVNAEKHPDDLLPFIDYLNSQQTSKPRKNKPCSTT